MTPEIIEKIAKIEAHTARIPDMDERLRRLERDRSYAVGWLAGALAAGTTLGALLARIVGFLAIALGLSGCGGAFCDDVFGLPAHWPLSRRPVPVLISKSLSEECQENVAFGLDFWAMHGVRYLRPKLVADAETLIALPGTIAVSARGPRSDDSEILGVTRSFAAAGRMFSAKIWFRECSPLVVAHELGHALGLAHVDDWHNVMYSSVTRGDVTEEQLEQVR